jgi:hypothetical protein
MKDKCTFCGEFHADHLKRKMPHPRKYYLNRARHLLVGDLVWQSVDLLQKTDDWRALKCFLIHQIFSLQESSSAKHAMFERDIRVFHFLLMEAGKQMAKNYFRLAEKAVDQLDEIENNPFDFRDTYLRFLHGGIL